MQMLPSSSNPTGLEKFFRILLPAVTMFLILWGGSKIFNFFALDIVEMLKNVWWIVGLGLPLVLISLFVLRNPMFIVMFFNNIAHSITSALIRIDPLSYMDRYVDILLEKLGKVRGTIVNLRGKKTELERTIKEAQDNMKYELKLAEAALKIGKQSQASVHGENAAGYRDSLTLYKDPYDRMVKILVFLEEIAENWDVSIQKLQATIKRKRTEFDSLKAAAAAIDQAEDFVSGNTEQGKIYQESVRALEASVSQKIASIEDFEKRSKGIFDAAKIEKVMNQNEGLEMLKSFMKEGKLNLSDFDRNVPQFNFNGVQDIEYQEVKPNKIESQKFNLLD